MAVINNCWEGEFEFSFLFIEVGENVCTLILNIILYFKGRSHGPKGGDPTIAHIKSSMRIKCLCLIWNENITVCLMS